MMVNINCVQEILDWPQDDAGWHVAPTGEHIILGSGCAIGDGCTIGSYCKIGNYFAIGNYCAIGDGCTIGSYCTIGNCCAISNYCAIGDGCTIGNYCAIGSGCTLGNCCAISNDCAIGSGCRLGDNESSTSINLKIRQALIETGAKILAWKWVTKERLSPIFDGGYAVEYFRGVTIIASDTVVSDQQCDRGLHVLQIGYRPEWVGLCGPDHQLIPLLVEIDPKDICYAGLPGNSIKLRVKALRVLE